MGLIVVINGPTIRWDYYQRIDADSAETAYGLEGPHHVVVFPGDDCDVEIECGECGAEWSVPFEYLPTGGDFICSSCDREERVKAIREARREKGQRDSDDIICACGWGVEHWRCGTCAPFETTGQKRARKNGQMKLL